VLVIPVAQEQNVVRRHPWIAYAIVILNVVVFVAFALAGNGAEKLETAQKARHEAMEMLARHPYLIVPAALVSTLPEETRVALGRARERAVRKGKVPAGPTVPEQQAKLDQLASRFDAAFRALPSQTWGYVPARPRRIALLTSLFMHAGWMHLLGNMLFLLLTGPFVEDVYGRPLFAAFYLGGGIAATLVHALAQGDSQAGLVGASGAIAAVMGAFLVRFGTRRIGFLMMPIPLLPWIRTHFLMPAFVVIPAWLVQQLLFAHSDRASSTAWWAHIGGLAAGVAFALVMRLSRAEQRLIDPAIQKKVELTTHPSLEQLVDARVEGRLEEARALLDDALRHDPASLDAWSEAYELGLAANDGPATSRALVRLLDLYGKAKEEQLAARLVRDVRWRELGSVSPQAYLSAAAWLEKDGDLRHALELYDELARSSPADPKSLRALVRRGEIFKTNGDHREARAALERARLHPAYGPPWQAGVEASLAALPVPVVLALTEAEIDV
jgi:membrane associated rhomboid family serine protease